MGLQVAMLDSTIQDYGGYKDGLLDFFPSIQSREHFRFLPIYVAYPSIACPFLDAAETVRSLFGPFHVGQALMTYCLTSFFSQCIEPMLHRPRKRFEIGPYRRK